MNICTHCHEAAPLPLTIKEDTSLVFCCQGCLTVYNILHQKGLEAYYAIKQDAGIFKRRAPVEITETNYSYLDDTAFTKDYSYENGLGEKVMEFYLEGIHCLACLWLVEKISEQIPGIKCIKLEMNRSVAIVTATQSAQFAKVAAEFNQIGYKPHPLKNNKTGILEKKKAERAMLIRIGIAGASSGNIMLYAISLYGGATNEFIHLFHSLTVFFAFPVLVYSAFPFYKNACLALKTKKINIDVPISLALLMGAVAGYTNYFKGIEENYFDSLTALVFLLLLSRYFLTKIQEKGLSTNDLQFSHMSESVMKSTDDELVNFISIPNDRINIGDRLKISIQQTVPADGRIIRGKSTVNNALLTGESLPATVNSGDCVFSGALNLSSEFILEVENIKEQTKLGKILKSVEQGWSLRSPVAQLTNKIAKFFVSVVCLLSVVLFVSLYLTKGFGPAFSSAITLLIVTCPCALAIATPLAFYRSLSQAASNGIIIKSDEALEKISKIENIFLDKTGTLTHGKLQVLFFKLYQETKFPLYDVIYSLEKNSVHPVAVALKSYIERNQNEVNFLELTETKEILGVGVSAVIGGNLYEIKEQKIFENGLITAEFTLNDTVREDSKFVIDDLKKMKLKIHVLTGDKRHIALAIAENVGLDANEVHSNLGPEDKSDFIKKFKSTMMIGDGANDAIAFKQADVGVAVLGAMDLSLKASDVYLTTPGLVPVRELIILSRETMRVVKRNLVLSLLYNSLSVIATFLGLITPLMAAIIMPLSSLTVVISCLIGTKQLRGLWK
jgi:heavy metal translocating P-type ATPase